MIYLEQMLSVIFHLRIRMVVIKDLYSYKSCLIYIYDLQQKSYTALNF